MLKVFYYSDNNEVLTLKLPENILVICPSPSLADAFRLYGQNKFEVITIAKWISDIKLLPQQRKVGKAELMLRLASAWKNYFPDYTENLFHNSFELFTEIRSFSLDLETVRGVLEELDADIGRSIQIFWAVMDALHLVDEHMAYQMKKEISIDRPLLFVGFKHLSAIQIDMLKALSEKEDIYFYLPREVKMNALSNDWINWLDTTELNVEMKESDKNEKQVKTLFFSPRKLNFYLKNLLESKSIADAPQISLVGGSVGFLQTQEVLVKKYFFKEPVDLFIPSKNKVFSKLKNAQVASMANLLLMIAEEKKVAVKKQFFLDFKVWDLLEKASLVYQEYSEHIDFFVLHLLEYVVDLNTPRNFFVPHIRDERERIINFEELKYQANDKENILILSKESSPFKAQETKHPENLLKILRVLGPVKRGGLDILFAKSDLKNLLKNPSNILLLEEGILETDPGVRDLLNDFDFVPVILDLNFVPKKIEDFFGLNHIKYQHPELAKDKVYSASRLQSYDECPRKYYLTFVEKLDETPLEKMSIGADEKGSLEHAIIEEFFSNNKVLDGSALLELCRLKLDAHLHNHNTKRDIDFKEYNEVLFELAEYTQNGLNVLYNLQSERPEAKIIFEVALHENKYFLRGFIDCLIEENGEYEIYDFKRSSAAVGSKEELIRFEKLQLWIYAWAMGTKKIVKKIAYINISEPEKVLALESLNIESFEEHLGLLVNQFDQEIDYKANPKKEKVCHFCLAQKFCPKGMVQKSIEGNGHGPNP